MSPSYGSVPRCPIRAMCTNHNGDSWLAALYELGAEQLQQSLTITVCGWSNGTAGCRKARMMLSSSWYHKIKLVMTDVTKQYAVCHKGVLLGGGVPLNFATSRVERETDNRLTCHLTDFVRFYFFNFGSLSNLSFPVWYVEPQHVSFGICYHLGKV